MTIIKTEHPEYAERKEYNQRADDVYNDRIKDKGEKYLPIGASMPTTVKGCEDFNAYQRLKYKTTTLPMAVFYNFTNLTLNAAIGAIMRKPPTFQFNEGGKPSVLDYMIDNVDGKGNGLTQLARMLLGSQYLKGRGGVLVSVPEMGSLADAMTGKKVPRLVHYDANNILDWSTDYIDGVEVLTYLLLREMTTTRSDNNQLQIVERLIAFNLTDSGVEYEITEDDKTIEQGQLMKAGTQAKTIPFHLAGAVNNDWSTDPAPMRTQIDLNLLHYIMMSRDMQARWDLAQLQLVVNVGNSPDPSAEMKALNPMGIMSGTAVPIAVANGGDAKYLQANPSNLLSVAPEQILTMAIKAGAQLFQESGNETATGANIRSSSSTASMSSIGSNCGDCIYNAIIDAAGYFGTIGNIVLDEIQFMLNTEFFSNRLDATQLQAYMAMVLQGVYPMRAYYDTLRSSGDIAEDVSFDDYLEQLQEENGLGGMPSVTGEDDANNGQ